MKKFYMVLGLLVLSNSSFAMSDEFYNSESWYNSKEMNTTLSLVKQYNSTGCNSADKENCDEISKEISKQFMNPMFKTSAFEYIMFQLHPKRDNYIGGEMFMLQGDELNLSSMALRGKFELVEQILRSDTFKEEEKEPYFVDLRKDFYKSSSLHQDYVYSTCGVETASWTNGSGSGTSHMRCVTDYNLKYLEILDEIIGTLNF